MNRRKRIKLLREWIYLGIAVLISIFFIIFNDSSFNDTLAEAGLDAFSILKYDYFSLRERKKLQSEVVTLKEELAKAQREKNIYQSSYHENIKLKELLGIKLPDSVKFVYTKVTGNPPSDLSNTILISSGKKDSISKGDMVVNEKGLVGIVEHTGTDISKVRLIKHPEMKIPVITEKGKQQGIMIPVDNLKAHINEIIKYQDIETGEKVFTSDISRIYLADLLVGIITDTSDSSATIDKYVEITYSVDFNELNDLFVLKKPEQEVE